MFYFIGIQLLEQSMKGGAMIHFPQMAEFMEDDSILKVKWDVKKLHREADSSDRRATPPTALKGSDGDTRRHGIIMENVAGIAGKAQEPIA